ncbi:hypothetical protein KEN51_CDS0204 [Pseudomonas phage vB_Pae10145-KEN51]|uniref:PHIKZ183 n=7 Tax=root TaxID=1 RepID=Q8SCX9_BPDPK|nr:hypothetical protein [Pseudomonas aeruginosa]NP_803749.1 PHIKZ183 [Pseudomonas phage phiKZ]YP_009617473.1 hypothetical protein FDI90_gp185 [Pseudomonas phage PA7]ANM44981.1 hypothetical protein KTN4_223 [Pseudomonas phage KTN4]QJB22859.1 hypothetical protein fnug_216 [Pseudomonas phage fnug]USL86801.1 hypothetical protein CDGHABPJ_00343 [Pseudomonas phage OMKO1]WAX23396.1 hypothetical protein [Pseudomonas phage pPA-N1803-4At.2]WNV47887.1 hypothetical protein [Pseudomonas phage fMGyn-Pae01
MSLLKKIGLALIGSEGRKEVFEQELTKLSNSNAVIDQMVINLLGSKKKLDDFLIKAEEIDNKKLGFIKNRAELIKLVKSKYSQDPRVADVVVSLYIGGFIY